MYVSVIELEVGVLRVYDHDRFIYTFVLRLHKKFFPELLFFSEDRKKDCHKLKACLLIWNLTLIISRQTVALKI